MGTSAREQFMCNDNDLAVCVNLMSFTNGRLLYVLDTNHCFVVFPFCVRSVQHLKISMPNGNKETQKLCFCCTVTSILL